MIWDLINNTHVQHFMEFTGWCFWIFQGILALTILGAYLVEE